MTGCTVGLLFLLRLHRLCDRTAPLIMMNGFANEGLIAFSVSCLMTSSKVQIRDLLDVDIIMYS